MEDNKEKLRKLRRGVTESFSSRMRKYGFNRNSSGTFYRKTDFGRIGITLFYHEYQDSLKVEPSASIKVDEAENILFDYRSEVRLEGIPPKKPNDFTVSENLGNIKSGIWRQWFIDQQSDVEKTLDEIEKLVVEVGLPFLIRFEDPELLLEEMVVSTKEPTVLGNPIFRFSQLFALALALNRRDLFDEIRPFFEEKLKNNKQFRIENVVRFFDWLDSRFPG